MQLNNSFVLVKDNTGQWPNTAKLNPWYETPFQVRSSRRNVAYFHWAIDTMWSNIKTCTNVTPRTWMSSHTAFVKAIARMSRVKNVNVILMTLLNALDHFSITLIQKYVLLKPKQRYRFLTHEWSHWKASCKCSECSSSSHFSTLGRYHLLVELTTRPLYCAGIYLLLITPSYLYLMCLILWLHWRLTMLAKSFLFLLIVYMCEQIGFGKLCL